MRVVIIGGSGHVGTYLVPRLVEAGHDVINISRAQREPYQAHGAWRSVRRVNSNRQEEDAQGVFGQRVRDLEPDVVIDMICFTLASAQQIVESVRGQVQHFLHCGTIWSMGHSVEVPATEETPRHPFEEYGIQKSAIQDYLLEQARRYNFPATVLQPGHIVGPGWIPINPAGNLDPVVFTRLAHGEEVALPNLGLETLHHVHADDVAQSFMQALANRSVGLGEAFHVVSPAALTLRGYAERVAAWFGQPACLKFLSWEEWRRTVSDEYAAQTWDHIAHSPNASIAKAQRLLDYHPRYSSLQAVHESLQWLILQSIVEGN
ncbi:MAG: NAD-dependent epimerase/dehydratase family protein [Chloroflexi bacterium]|nr:MAG: NAD-dependent epimerase/dehydratase family protein [Chloroflexota bacterium]RPI96549.1 MAG: NAD-dependent epimerase/dehydratase family protein [Chloroflexota bacterium]